MGGLVAPLNRNESRVARGILENGHAIGRAIRGGFGGETHNTGRGGSGGVEGRRVGRHLLRKAEYEGLKCGKGDSTHLVGGSSSF